MSKRVSFYQGVLDKDSLDKLKQIGAERVEMFLCENGEVDRGLRYQRGII